MLLAQQDSGCLVTLQPETAHKKQPLPAPRSQARSQDPGILAKRQLQTRERVERENTASLCSENTVSHRSRQRGHAHDLAVKAVERAQLRHKRRNQRCSCIEQHGPVSDELDTDDLWAELPPPASSFGALLRQSGTTPRFDRTQEMHLAKVMAQGRHLIVMLDPMQQHTQQLHAYLAVQSLSPYMALQQAHAAEVAKRKLAQAHLWLVFKVVSAYHRQKQVGTDDLVQAGLYGLDTALNKFDPDRGNRLSTVAYMWIKEAVGRAYNEMTGTIKISERTRTNMRKVLAAQQQLPVQQSTCIESLQNLTGLSQRTVASALQACCLKELSVEAATASSTSGGKAQDAIPLIDQMSSNGMLEQQPDLQDPMADCWMAQTLMEGALQKLPDAEATVLHHVYGLQDGLPKSRPQVAKLMGTGLHHVRKLEQRAMAFLRTLNMAESLHAAESVN